MAPALTLFTRGFLGLLGPGMSAPLPYPLYSENSKAMTTKLRVLIVGQKTFPLRSATSPDDVIWRENNVMFSNGGHLGSAILGFLIFPKSLKSPKIDQEVLKINKLTRKWSKIVKFTLKSYNFSLKRRTFKFLNKNASHKQLPWRR